jgi:hypothetical protein
MIKAAFSNTARNAFVTAAVLTVAALIAVCLDTRRILLDVVHIGDGTQADIAGNDKSDWHLRAERD